MRYLSILALTTSLFVGCSTAPMRPEQPAPAASAPDTVRGAWEFSVTSGKDSYSATFVFSDTSAETCLSGAWYQARLVSTGGPKVSQPAYRYEGGRLELLLSTKLCDAYNSFVGDVSGNQFNGEHVSYGLFGSTEHGKVTGVRR